MTDIVNRDHADADARTGASSMEGGERTQMAQAVVQEEMPEQAPTALLPEPDQATEAESQPAPPQEVVVEKPAPGQTAEVDAEAGQIYVMNFDPNLAQVLIQGQDFILQFADGSRIVFDDLVALAQRGLSPFLRVGGITIGGNVILAQAQALAGESVPGQGLPTLETAAGPGAGARGGGGSRYSDDTGSLIDVLSHQGPIPYVVQPFSVPPPLNIVIEEDAPPLTPPTGTLLINPGGPPVPGLTFTPPTSFPPGTPVPPGFPPPPDLPPGGDPRAFGSGAASSYLSEDTPAFGQLNAQATSGVLTEIRVADLPTAASGWTINISQLIQAVQAAGGSVDSSGLANGGVIVISFPTSAGVTSFTGLIGFTAPTNSDVDFLGVDVIVTATSPTTGESIQGGTLDITIPVDAVVDGTEVLLAGQVIPGGAFVVGDSASLTSALQLTLDAFDQTSQAGAAGDADAAYTQGGGDMFDGSEQVTQIVVTLSVADSSLGLPTLNFTLPGGIVASATSGTASSVTFTVNQGTAFSAVQALVSSLSVTRPSADFFGDIQVSVQTTTVETDPDGFEADPSNNVDVDSYALLVTFTSKPSALFLVGNALGYIPEDTPTPIELVASLPPSASNSVLTLVQMGNLPTTGSGWVIDISALQSFVAGLAGTNSVQFDGASGTLTIVLDVAAGVTSLNQAITVTPPANSDLDLLDVTVDATATNVNSGATAAADTFVGDVVVDAVVDGSELIQTAPAVAAINTTAALNLDLALGGDSTSGGLPGESPPGFESQGGTDIDGSETVTLIGVTLTAGTLDFTLPAGVPASIVTTSGGDTWSFDTSGLSESQTEALVASFGVIPPTGFTGVVGVTVTTTTAEAATVAGGGFVGGDAEAFDGDNVDIDQYQFEVKFRDGPSGSVAADPDGDGALSEDTRENVNISAAVGTVGDELSVIRVTGLPGPSATGQTPNTPTAQWIINFDALEASLPAGATVTLTLDPGGTTQTLTITFPPGSGIASFDQDIFMQAPLDSDVDVTGVQIFVEATDGTLVSDFTGPETTIPVDAVVDGSEVLGPLSQSVKGNDVGPQLLNLTIQLGNDSTVGIGESQGNLPNDFSNDGDLTESVQSFSVTLTPSVDTFGAPELAWNMGLGAGVTVTPGAGGATTWSFDTSGLSFADIQTLVASLAVDPPTGFDGDITVDVSTTTVENNTPEGTVPASGLEPSPGDNTDVDDYQFTLTVDTVPVAVDDPHDVNEAPNINLVFVIDRSGSMWDPNASGDPDSGVAASSVTLPNGITSDFFNNSQHVLGNGNLTRFGLLKIALVTMLNAYGETGAEVNVMLVQFASQANVISDANPDAGNWFNGDLSAVISAIVGLSGAENPNNFTNYEAAVQTAMANFGVNLPGADQNLLYFLSDGVPTVGGNPGDNSITDATLDAWEAFLSDNLMKSIAVGIGEGISGGDDDLEDVAVPNDPFDDNPLIVLDESTLIQTLVDTVPNVVNGNILDNDDFGGDGQGTPAITQIVINGVTYSYDGTNITNSSSAAVIAGSVLAVMTLIGGQLEFDFATGDFSYTAPEVSTDQTESFAYTIQDGNGDLAGANLVIEVRDQTAPPTATADSVIANSGIVEIADAWLTFNDLDPQGDVLGVAEVSGIGASGGFADVVTLFNFGAGGNSFTYQAHDFIQLSSQATVSLAQVAGNNLTGTEAGEILIGGAGTDVISGMGGRDVLAGFGGADTLDGGAGDDLLVGGAGADQITGGAGSDIFQITADAFGSGIDNFVDFALDQDVVDLSQLLTDFEGGDDLSQFVQVLAGTNSIQVDVDGGGNFQSVATLAGGISVGEVLTVVTDADGTQVGITAT